MKGVKMGFVRRIVLALSVLAVALGFAGSASASSTVPHRAPVYTAYGCEPNFPDWQDSLDVHTGLCLTEKYIVVGAQDEVLSVAVALHLRDEIYYVIWQLEVANYNNFQGGPLYGNAKGGLGTKSWDFSDTYPLDAYLPKHDSICAGMYVSSVDNGSGTLVRSVCVAASY
jgi:hypothetical protein